MPLRSRTRPPLRGFHLRVSIRLGCYNPARPRPATLGGSPPLLRRQIRQLPEATFSVSEGLRQVGIRYKKHRSSSVTRAPGPFPPVARPNILGGARGGGGCHAGAARNGGLFQRTRVATIRFTANAVQQYSRTILFLTRIASAGGFATSLPARAAALAHAPASARVPSEGLHSLWVI